MCTRSASLSDGMVVMVVEVISLYQQNQCVLDCAKSLQLIGLMCFGLCKTLSSISEPELDFAKQLLSFRTVAKKVCNIFAWLKQFICTCGRLTSINVGVLLVVCCLHGTSQALLSALIADRMQKQIFVFRSVITSDCKRQLTDLTPLSRV